MIMFLGLLSGLLQILGYYLYIRDTRIEPNPVSWLMFAYGTAIITVLEYDRQAAWTDLVLPIACSISSMYIAFRCWRSAHAQNPHHWWPRDWWPEEREDKAAFLGDILITIMYVTAWLLLLVEFVPADVRSSLALVFLIGSNLTTAIAFVPLARGVRRNPEVERPLPWIVWTSAYASLGLATMLQHGIMTELMIYPVTCFVLHAAIARWAWPARMMHHNLRRAQT